MCLRVASIGALVVLLATLHPGPAASKVGGCTLQVDGRTYLDGPCNVDLEPDGSFSIGTGDTKGRSRHFAYVNRDPGAETAEGHWNGTAGGSHAHDRLGILRHEGACWVNDRARVCARAKP